MITTEWWHLYVAHDAETDMAAKVLIGPVPLGPDEVDDEGIAPRSRSVVLMPGLALTHAASWDHQPDDAEQDEHMPEGHRSTDDVPRDTVREEQEK